MESGSFQTAVFQNKSYLLKDKCLIDTNLYAQMPEKGQLSKLLTFSAPVCG